MAHFLSLPAEIRNMIYGYCLVVRREIFPIPCYYDESRLAVASHFARDAQSTKQEPNLALLRVNKQINQESEPVYYGRNVWRIENPWEFLDKAALFRDVTLCLDFRELSYDVLTDHLDDFAQFLEKPCQENYGPDSPVRQRQIHDDRVDYLVISEWERKISTLGRMGLDTLIIDIKRCWCFHGCCRLIDQLDMTGIKARTITVLGIYNEEEEMILLRKLPPGSHTNFKDGNDYKLVVDCGEKAKEEGQDRLWFGISPA
ncbi:MAG: hypothetical protein LQ349_003281 [Xanthoria aureola]|nr:MAG: hypothetical protein LQ349_003281 [Xanthoria aureola]